MASNNNYDEKPNLRPTKRTSASGKSIFLHHNPNQSSDKSYIHAIWKNNNNNSAESSTNKQDPLGIEQPHVEYSLNKKRRWEILSDFRRDLTYDSSTSSDNELDVQSDSEQQRGGNSRKEKKNRQKNKYNQRTKYRLYELHNTNLQANCVNITTNIGPQHRQVPRKTYMQASLRSKRRGETQINDEDNEKQRRMTADVTYYAMVPPPKEKQLRNIRKQRTPKSICI